MFSAEGGDGGIAEDVGDVLAYGLLEAVDKAVERDVERGVFHEVLSFKLRPRAALHGTKPKRRENIAVIVKLE